MGSGSFRLLLSVGEIAPTLTITGLCPESPFVLGKDLINRKRVSWVPGLTLVPRLEGLLS